jgi:DNA-binding ferritin-like protein
MTYQYKLTPEQEQALAFVVRRGRVPDGGVLARTPHGQAAGTLAWFKAHTRLDEGENIPHTRRLIEHLKDDHESIMETPHADIGATEDKHNDAVTSNQLQDISDKRHKMRWMLRMILRRSMLE